ncbi:hypothetical protein [Pseudomonas gingeri]|uniref:hypothetical protein n=1 Tax=Pseudomonas gingeri TaxID=117681 RepID=UPI0015A16DB3|nr:hypothetical protein [Pseudomonas gingeri]NWE46355.1 hypothetical protein [Pseudomonas gingeri]
MSLKPILKWSCRELADGWVMIGVDVSLEQGDDPEELLGYRRAVHPFQFDESDNPVMEFQFLIAEMTYRITRGLEGCGDAQPHPASRAGAFGGCDEASRA